MIATLRSFVIMRTPLAIFLIIYFFLALATFKDFGLTMDEFFVYTRGQYFYNKVVGNDAHLQKGFVVHEEGNEDILYNNSSYPAILYTLNNNQSYEGYHLINMLLASTIFIAMYELLLFVYRKPLFALIGPLLLFFTPRFLGDIPANPKDIPFAIGYFLSIAFIIISQKWNKNLQLILLGVLVGLSASIRVIGFSIIPIYILFKMLTPWETNISKLCKRGISVVLESTILILISFLIFLVNMPYVGADPINHFPELLNITTKYPWYGNMLFFGENLAFNQRPLSYLPIWLAITTPPLILGLSVYAFWKKMSTHTQSLKILILISLAVHTLFYIFLKPIIYNGLRHYLFILPQLVILASLGSVELMQNKKLCKWIYAIFALFIVSMMGAYVHLHPYEYTYFNSITRGIAGAQGTFEIDYWAASDKEAMAWLSTYLKENDITSTAVFSCSKSDSLHYYMPQVSDVNTNIQKADYIICFDKKELSAIQKYIPGTIIHEIKRSNVTYSTIFQVD